MRHQIITSEFCDLRVACVQCTSSTHHRSNLTVLRRLIRRAVDEGANLVSLPECANVCNQHATSDMFFRESEDPVVQGLSELAHTLGCYLHVGSVLVLADDTYVSDKETLPRLVNRALVFDKLGRRVAQYDKMHLFRLQLGNIDIDEGRQFIAGSKTTIAATPWGKLGLSICYDVRYGNLFQHLCQNGAHILAIPAAFTCQTGKAHWHTLVRARAIENACFVIAAAQCGTHADGRTTYGHSLIVDPWGEILAQAGDKNEEVIVATLHAKALARARTTLGAWSDRKQKYL